MTQPLITTVNDTKSEWSVPTTPPNLTNSLQLNAYMSSGVVEVPLSSVTPSERSVVNASTLDVTDINLSSTSLAPARPTPDDFPDGGHGWIIVLACSVIRYAVAPASA